MNEPERLSLTGSAEERATLQAARSLRASDASRQRMLMALGLAASVSLVPASASLANWLQGALEATWRFMLTKWGAGSIAIAAAAGGGTVLAVQQAQETAVAPGAAPARAAKGRATPPPAPASAGLAPATGAESSPAAANASAEVPRPPTPETAAPRAPEPSPRPAATARAEAAPEAPASPAEPAGAPPAAPTEIELFDSARAALRSGNASLALSTLEQRARLFPKGALALEARVLRIEALGRAGRTVEAISEAESFLDHHPSGLLSHRVRQWLERQEGTRR
jgi:hypothetical protein